MDGQPAPAADTSVDTGMTDTSNLSMAIQPQYSSFAQVSSSFRRMRRDSFSNGHGRPDMETVHIPNKYVPTPAGPMGGIEWQPRALAGMGEFVVDPMQNLTPETLSLEGRSYRSRERTAGPRTDQSRYRSRGVAAYHEENRRG